MRNLLHFAGHWTGISDEAGSGYAFWSGFGSDLGLLGGVAVYVRHRNCHQKGCWRIGHPHEGVVRCRKHPHAGTGASLEQKLLAMEGRLVDLLTIPASGGPQAGDNS